MTVGEAVLEKLKTLPTSRKQELPDFAEFLERKETVKTPRHSLKGALKDLQVTITDEDMREARNEMWRGYTKDTEDKR